MGHRALVAYRRPDRRYDLRYSHWGGDTLSFADGISAATPLAAGAIEPALVAEAITCDRVLTEHLDPRVYEALYLVDPAADYAVDSYRVCWLAWDGGTRPVGSQATADPIGDGSRGAIVADDTVDDHTLRVWFRATKTTLADVIELGGLSRRAAQATLEARVCEEYDGTPYTYGDSTAKPEDEPTPTRWSAGDDHRGERHH